MKLPLFTLLTLLSCNGIAAEPVLIDPTQPSGNSTAPAIASTTTPASWQLMATQITPRKRLAIINGTAVTEGGSIGNARVLQVSHAQVKLEVQGEIITLHLLQSEVRKTR